MDYLVLTSTSVTLLSLSIVMVAVSPVLMSAGVFFAPLIITLAVSGMV